jgi:acyl-CoA synthetase (AMP-forming)/AMP-acid ligase II
MQVHHLLLQHARRTPDAPVCIIEGRRQTYGELARRSQELAASLAGAGLQVGDRVVMMLRNGPKVLETLFATAMAGLVLVPVHSGCTPAELQFVLEDAQPRALIADADAAAARIEAAGASALTVILAGAIEVGGIGISYENFLGSSAAAPQRTSTAAAELAPWLLAYTSGSTGRPKGVVLSQRAKYLSALTEALDAGLRADDVALINTPMFHVHGLVFALMLVAAGGSIVFTASKAADEVLQVIESNGVTQLSMVPTIYRSFVDAARTGAELSSVRVARSTGAPLTPALRREILARFPGLPLHVMYGATEAGAITVLRPEELERKDGSVGQALLGVELQARDGRGQALPPDAVGEIFIRSDYLSTGYLRNGQLPAGEYVRWLSLGDLGRIDRDGFLFLQGRSTDVIISGGENISAAEVEAALERHAAVLAAAVISLPDPYWGEKVHAFVQLRPGQSVSCDELLAAAAQHLAGYKLPKAIELVPELPRNPFGKIDKRMLRRPAATPPQA